MKLNILLFFVFCTGSMLAQNLLPNPSFEETVQLSFGRTFAEDWISPNQSSPEHYNPNSRLDWRVPKNYTGFQYGHTGESYFGIKMYTLFASVTTRSARDYIQCKISNRLVKDSIYCFQAYVTLADSCNYASRNQLSLKFSAVAIRSNSTANLNEVPDIIFSPSDYIVNKTNWLRFNFEYTAKGGEEYLTIGNFNDTNSIDTLYLGNGGDRVNLDYNSTYYFIDDVYLGSCDSLPFDTGVGIRESELISRNHRLYPNPANDFVKLALKVESNEEFTFSLYDLQGRLVQEKLLNRGEQHQIVLEQLKRGLFVYQIRNKQGEFLSGKLVINR